MNASIMIFKIIVWQSIFPANINSQYITNLQLDQNTSIIKSFVGEMYVLRKHWTVLSKVDLSNYNRDLNTLKQNKISLDSICCEFLNITDFDYCKEIKSRTQAAFDDLISKEDIIDHFFLENNRKKRAIIDIVGRASKVLFGTLDDEDGLKLNKNSELIRQQTSIIHSIYEELNETESNTKTTLQGFDLAIKNLTTFIKEIQNDNLQMQNFKSVEHLNELLTLMSYSTSQLSIRQNKLIEILVAASNSKLHPFLISPFQLKEKLMFIQNHIQYNLISPIEIPKISLNNIYNLIKVNAYKMNNIIVFEMEIPLAEKENFKMYKLTPVPVKVTENVYSIMELNKIIAIKNTSYVILDNIDECVRIPNAFLCQKPIITYMSNKHQSCEIQLYTNSTPTLCATYLVHLENDMWIICDTENIVYIYNHPENADVICENHHVSITIKDKGVLKLNKTTACEVITHNFKIYLHNKEETANSITMVSPINDRPIRIFKWKKDETSHRNKLEITLPAIIDSNTKLRDIGREIKVLDNMVENQPSDKHWLPSMHDFAIYGIIAIMILGYAISKHIKNRKARATTNITTTSSSPNKDEQSTPNNQNECQRTTLETNNGDRNTTAKWT